MPAGLCSAPEHLFAYLVLITALVFLASGATQWLGQVLESTIAASLITGGFFLLLFLVLFLFRKRLFMNTFVRLFINIFFHEKDPNALED